MLNGLGQCALFNKKKISFFLLTFVSRSFWIFDDEFVLHIIAQKFALCYTIPEQIGKQNTFTDPIHKVDNSERRPFWDGTEEGCEQ